MDQKEIWEKYITAQRKILEHKSLPIAINNDQKLFFKNNYISLSVDQEIYKKIFIEHVKKVFSLDKFDFSNNCILQDIAITEKIIEKDLLKLKDQANSLYIEFNENPVVEGFILDHSSNNSELENILGERLNNYLFRKDGQVYLNLDEKVRCDKISGIKVSQKAGAIFSIKPSVEYYISKHYKNINIFKINSGRFKVEGRLHEGVVVQYSDYIGLRLEKYELCFAFREGSDYKYVLRKLIDMGMIFPKLIDNVMTFDCWIDINNGDVCRVVEEKIRLTQLFRRYFYENDFNMTVNTIYTYDVNKMDSLADIFSNSIDDFWARLYNEIHDDTYQLSKVKGKLSFDFESVYELKEKLNHVKSIFYVDIYDRGAEHKFKFNLIFDTGLKYLQDYLRKKIPYLETRLIANGQKLLFRNFYKTGNKGLVRDSLNDLLCESIDAEKYYFEIKDTFREKYICEENSSLKIELEDEKLQKLKYEDFYFGDDREKFYLGRLQFVNYPELIFSTDNKRKSEIESNIQLRDIKAIFPDLKGEQDKIIRLSDTISKLTSKTKLPNNNVKKFLFDSSYAKGIEDIEYLLNSNSLEWKHFEEKVYSKNLNLSQKQAIFKSLYSEELALIQGPPGTGKSTAIAEIVWQHVLVNQKERILLTSETNLAVDNAIDRLKNKKQNIVKPIRFGNENNLESEGRFYSLLSIKDWVKSSSNNTNNTISHWMNNIASRVSVGDDSIINDALYKWKSHLTDPSLETKNIFLEVYLAHVNIIGATGSSIGKLNSRKSYTSFFHSYLQVFSRHNYEPIINWEECNKINVCFDIVIMDEASKATPPELALPIVYGKKTIIVGDHRQLPPMIASDDIKNTLMSIGEKELAKTLSRKEFEKSQFEYLFERIDKSIKGTFDTQYRMHPIINDVISQFYVKDGGLKCGLPLSEDEHKTFSSQTSRYHGLRYKDLLSPSDHVLWVNVNYPEIKEGTSRVNHGEVEAIDSILNIIKKSEGYDKYNSWLEGQSKEEKQVGLISFYGNQIKYLEGMIKENHEDMEVRLSTVDRFQGMERNIIIVSLVRSNMIASSKEQHPNTELYGSNGYQNQTSLGFAEFPNRLNVALSRARRLLVIVGNKEHFCSKDIYKNVYETILNSSLGRVIEGYELEKLQEDE